MYLLCSWSVNTHYEHNHIPRFTVWEWDGAWSTMCFYMHIIMLASSSSILSSCTSKNNQAARFTWPLPLLYNISKSLPLNERCLIPRPQRFKVWEIVGMRQLQTLKKRDLLYQLKIRLKTSATFWRSDSVKMSAKFITEAFSWNVGKFIRT